MDKRITFITVFAVLILVLSIIFSIQPGENTGMARTSPKASTAIKAMDVSKTETISDKVAKKPVTEKFSEQLRIPEAAKVPIMKQKSIALIIDADIYPGISNSINQFVNDLSQDKYNVIINISSMQTVEEVKAYLQQLYQSASPKLEGAMLIGDIPKPRYLLHIPAQSGCLNFDRGPEEYISYQFYQDLDGDYIQNDPSSCVTPGCYDSHTGKVQSEIWVSVLPHVFNDAYTIDKINDYFQKNHEYRAGTNRPNQGFFSALIGAQIDTAQIYNTQYDQLVNSQYAWNPLTSRGNSGIFIDNSIGDPINYPNASQGYETALLSGDYDFAEIGGHGTPTSIAGINIPTRSIIVTTDWVNTHNIHSTFIWSTSCNNGDIDVDNNLLTALVYSNSTVLLAAGATGEYGGLGTNTQGYFRQNIGQALAAGKTNGEAYLKHINTPYQGCNLYQREYFTAPTIFIGDMTLKLQEYMN